jgi:hypothetical protein
MFYLGKRTIWHIFHHERSASFHRGREAIGERIAHPLSTPARGISVAFFHTQTHTSHDHADAPYNWATQTRSEARSSSFTVPSSSCVARPTFTRTSRTFAQLSGLWEPKSTPTLGPRPSAFATARTSSSAAASKHRSVSALFVKTGGQDALVVKGIEGESVVTSCS